MMAARPARAGHEPDRRNLLPAQRVAPVQEPRYLGFDRPGGQPAAGIGIQTRRHVPDVLLHPEVAPGGIERVYAPCRPCPRRSAPRGSGAPRPHGAPPARWRPPPRRGRAARRWRSRPLSTISGRRNTASSLVRRSGRPSSTPVSSRSCSRVDVFRPTRTAKRSAPRARRSAPPRPASAGGGLPRRCPETCRTA